LRGPNFFSEAILSPYLFSPPGIVLVIVGLFEGLIFAAVSLTVSTFVEAGVIYFFVMPLTYSVGLTVFSPPDF